MLVILLEYINEDSDFNDIRIETRIATGSLNYSKWKVMPEYVLLLLR